MGGGLGAWGLVVVGGASDGREVKVRRAWIHSPTSYSLRAWLRLGSGLGSVLGLKSGPGLGLALRLG